MEETAPSPRRAIVVGVDGSPSSVAALQLAASLVPLAGDVIHAVVAWQYPPTSGFEMPMDWNYEKSAEQALDQALSEAFPDPDPYAIERRILFGAPAAVLIAQSTHASMVVVGSRGHGGFTGLLLGSVSSAVAERAACPVLVSHGALQLPDGETTALSPLGATA